MTARQARGKPAKPGGCYWRPEWDYQCRCYAPAVLSGSTAAATGSFSTTPLGDGWRLEEEEGLGAASRHEASGALWICSDEGRALRTGPGPGVAWRRWVESK